MLIFATFLFVFANDPNCVQVEYPPPVLPFAVDPNWGLWLPPFPDEPNRLAVQAGKWQRQDRRACDPDGDSFTITCDDPAVSVHLKDGLWSFSLDVRYDEWRVIRFSATDSPMDAKPATSRYWTAVYGMSRINHAPVLQ